MGSNLKKSFFSGLVKFTFSEQATKMNKIFTVNLTVSSNCQINGEDFVIFVAFLENMNLKKKRFLKNPSIFLYVMYDANYISNYQ